ncbi:TadE/TadG family type IV pilus assembly protein [Agromyces cerinus]|uniref:TadE/TadG family type IV pilus assembly protein n=1 Tax=Agromyces cerinus TaxID=33878 RepID=UPI000940EBE3|nr:TadE/TadG family type IV pilus assembly protein [Agromyces cerinus]
MTRDRERGAAAVEFALVLLPLCFLLLGIIDFGWVFNQQVSLSNAARESARHYVVHQADTPPGSVSAAIAIGESAAPTVDWTVAGAGITLQQGCDSSKANYSAALSASKSVSTTASIPMPSLTGFFTSMLGPTLSANGQMACIE